MSTNFILKRLYFIRIRCYILEVGVKRYFDPDIMFFIV